MVSDILSTIVAPSVVAGIVSATISYFQFHKNNKLIYITNERKEWRSDIRKIAEKMEAANTYEDIRKPLAKLKVRINAYGKYSDDVKKDTHIWKVMDQLQEQEGDFAELKQLLILYLSLLLKMDWERSKEEIKGNTYKTMYYVIAFLTEIIFAYVYLITLKLSVDFLFVVSFAVILIPIIMPERKGMNLDQAIEWFKEKDSKFLNSFTKAMGISILCFTASIVIECLLNGKWAQIGSFGAPIAFLIVAFLIRYLYEYRRYALDVSYYQNIELCRMTKKEEMAK